MLSRPLMELNHLRYFYEVAKAGSFTEAARQLRISQSALSKAVALLEDHEGVKLLQRSKKGVTLTGVGHEVFRLSAGIFSAVSEISNTCRGTKEQCEGPLRFGASDHLTNYILTHTLQTLRAQHPRVIPTVFAGTPHDIVDRLLDNELEFGLFFTQVQANSIDLTSLVTLPMALVCHPRFFEKSKKPSVRTLIDGVGLIGSIRSQYRLHPAKPILDQLRKDAPIIYESNSQEAQKRYCLAGGGVAYLASFMVEKEIEQKELVELPLKKGATTDLYLARKKGLPLSLSARTFLEMLTAQLANP